MAIENMRRWPMYIVFAGGILLILSLFNSWSMESELRNKFAGITSQLEHNVAEIIAQLQECSKQQTSCMEHSLTLLEEKDEFVNKANDLDKQKVELLRNISEYKNKFYKAEIQINSTLVDLEYCKTELRSSKSLQLTKSASLETLRLQKETLTTQLSEKNQKIDELTKEIEKLKSALTTKKAANPSISSKITPVGQPPKLSPALNVLNNPLNEAQHEDNNAKEDIEETNINDGNDFDQQIK